MTSPSPILEARGMIKTFGHVVGLAGVDLRLYAGEVLAVIGDNGAGKSTLIKCLSGAMTPDDGEILVDGRPVSFKSTQDAREAGIETVYQTLAVAPGAGHRQQPVPRPRGPQARARWGRLPDARRRRRCGGTPKSEIDKLGISTLQNISQAVETLSGGQRQAVAVARAAAFGGKVVILDEPTAALGVRETGQVLRLVKDAARPRPGHHPDQPQHAQRLRGRRPHPHPAPRPQRGRHHPEVPHPRRSGRHHDRRRRARTQRRRRGTTAGLTVRRVSSAPFVGDAPVRLGVDEHLGSGSGLDGLVELRRRTPSVATS